MNDTFRITAALLATALCARGAFAADAAPEATEAAAFPPQTVTIVVPFPPGGTADSISRLIAPGLSRSLGVPVIVVNRSGASGILGSAYAARAKADGSVILMATPPILAVNQWLYASLPYDPQKDFVPITNAVATANMIVVPSDLPVRTLREFVKMARDRPGELAFASGGNGTSHHLCGELLKKEARIDLVHVPYKGVGPAQVDLLGGRVAMMCDNISNVIEQVRSGRLRALAVTAPERSPLAPEVPTTAEEGYPEVLASVWFAFVAPAGTPQPIVARLQREISSALHEKSAADRIAALGLAVIADSPSHFGRFVAGETARLHELVKISGAKAD